MKILLAGPGTGKTTKISELLDDFGGGEACLVLSFTNATVNDLLRELSSKGISPGNCMTLHKFAIKYGHDFSRHILETEEREILKKVAHQTKIEFSELCDSLHVTTFEQMIDRFVSFATSNELYLKEKLNQFSYLIVDEYQDFNPHEQALIDTLLPYFKEAIILGDDDQCIYGFKDASNDKIIELFNDDSNTKLPHKHICYRCPDKVVEHATNLITKNSKRVSKPWKKSGKSGDLLYTQVESLETATDYVLRNVKSIQKNAPDSSVFILSPVGFISAPIKESLSEEGIDFEDADSPRIDQTLLEKSWEVKALFGAYKYVHLLFLAYKRLATRRPLYDLLIAHLKGGLNYDELFQKVLNKLPEEVLEKHKNLDEMLAIENYSEIKKLYSEAEGDKDDEKLEKLFLKREETESLKKVRCMSIHKSKGLGADYVFIVGLTEGILPNKKDGSDSLEAQRRVMYVGMTRAKKCLSLVSILKIPGKFANKVNKDDFKFDYKNRLWNGRASRFIEELKLR